MTTLQFLFFKLITNMSVTKNYLALFEMAHALQPVSVQTKEALQVETVRLGKFFS